MSFRRFAPTVCRPLRVPRSPATDGGRFGFMLTAASYHVPPWRGAASSAGPIKGPAKPAVISGSALAAVGFVLLAGSKRDACARSGPRPPRRSPEMPPVPRHLSPLPVRASQRRSLPRRAPPRSGGTRKYGGRNPADVDLISPLSELGRSTIGRRRGRLVRCVGGIDRPAHRCLIDVEP